MRRFASLAVLLILTAGAAAASPIDPKTIVVSGYAEIMTAPEYATVEIGVVTSNPVPSKALKQNAALMHSVMEAVRTVGIATADMETSQYSIEAQHPQDKGSYVVDFAVTTGYEVSNKLSVTVRDLSKVGDVIDAAVKAGANVSNSVTFTVKNQSEYFGQALAAAVRNARHYADVMASAENAKVGKMISVTDVASLDAIGYTYAPPPPPPPPPPPVYGTVILPGKIAIRANVVVTYAIEN
ncbi:MAG: SIMPL domain-containing protein [Alphaproteobacteria bacterium]|nr:SIMPL domain-containing protein [Alphaproteobacteria bacterium]MDE2629848.1 SIMPL domain-containing protein [Alphaproteobacteria bacterium]